MYAGPNAFWRFRRPPDNVAPVIVPGDGPAFFERHLLGCRTVAHVDNGVGLNNEEHGSPIAICARADRPWAQLWPSLQYLSA